MTTWEREKGKKESTHIPLQHIHTPEYNIHPPEHAGKLYTHSDTTQSSQSKSSS